MLLIDPMSAESKVVGSNSHKHVIDLTGDEDEEARPLPKRQRSVAPNETRNEPVTTGSAASTDQRSRYATPPHTHPIKASSDSTNYLFVKKSPFKSRQPWAPRDTQSPVPPQPAFARLSLEPTPSQRSSSNKVSKPTALPAQDHPSQSDSVLETIEPSGKSLHILNGNDKPWRKEDDPIRALPDLLNEARKSAGSSHSVSRQPPNILANGRITRSKTTNQTSNGETTDPVLFETPKPQISVVIDNTRRQRNISRSETPSSIQQKSIPPVIPKRPRQKVVVEIKDTFGDRKKILREIKKSKQIVDPTEVEAALGIHGFSDCYSTAADDAGMGSRAQPKAKKIKRSTVSLDWNHHRPPPDPKPKFDAKTLLSPWEQVRVVNEFQFEDLPSPPITFSNDVNAKQLDGKFQFISLYVKRPGVTIARKEGWGCRCPGVCGPNSCDCLLDIEKKFDDKAKKWPGRDPLGLRKIVPYKTRDDNLTVLDDNFLAASVTDTNSEIVECDESCGCTSNCWNRVVERGRTVPLEVFMTEKCGFGLRSSAAIARGQFIDLYLGELLTESCYQARELAAEDETPSYVFTLDWFDTSARNNYHVDGLHFGGPTRFINHSCNPNCRIFPVFNKGSDKKVYKLAVFAVQDVAAGKELTIDYNPLEAGKVYRVPRGDEEGVVLCQCGEAKCRVRLWPDKESKKGRGFSRS